MPSSIKVELVPHSASWETTADAEARLCEAFADVIVVVHHVGSTAIPGIHAKPIIDLMPVVRSVIELDAKKTVLLRLGYEYWGEYGISRRRYCTFDEPSTYRRQLQLHCFEPNSDQIRRHLAFRDYLRANPAKAQEYDQEKHRCRELHPDDSHAYSDAKAGWIERRLAEALDR
jgi:GrpB-like predicted nucleotidyltransferase (UPF0157 family)